MSTLDEMISKISKTIRSFRVDISKFKDEDTDEDHYVFYNMMDNHLSRMSKIHSETELEYFKAIVSAIVVSQDGRLSKNNVLNLRDLLHDQNISINLDDSASLLARWIKDKYFSENLHQVSLGVKSLVELQPYLRQTFPHNIRDCTLCTNVCIRGIDCSHLNVRLHQRCAQKYFDSIKNCSVCANEV